MTDAIEHGHRVLRLVCHLIGHRYELVSLDADNDRWTDECWICGRSRTRGYDRVTVSLGDRNAE